MSGGKVCGVFSREECPGGMSMEIIWGMSVKGISCGKVHRERETAFDQLYY